VTERTVVVGGGILGVAVARRLLEVRPGDEVVVLEKEGGLAAHQTGHNSGVVHAGLYYTPGSLKAMLCRRGVGMLHEFCVEKGLPYHECGKVVVARDETEEVRLADIFTRAQANGVPGVRMVGPDGLRDLEPHVTGVAALHSPHTAVVDFAAVTRALAEDVEKRGGRVVTGRTVTGFRHEPNHVVVTTPYEDHVADRVVLCAGLWSDRLATLAGDEADPRIVPFRGEYHLLRSDRRALVNGLVYPVPDPRYPFLGIHLTLRHDGEVMVGPNAVLALARDAYGWGRLRRDDLAETLRWPGFQAMARVHWRTGVREMVGSASRRAFVAAARRYVPELRTDDVLPGPAGVRAQAVARDGSLVDDFRINRLGRVVAVRNAPSPGATSSLAIAEHVVEQALAG
jgi:(S)-2-hydroxyglutarate dehydrogenase